MPADKIKELNKELITGKQDAKELSEKLFLKLSQSSKP